MKHDRKSVPKQLLRGMLTLLNWSLNLVAVSLGSERVVFMHIQNDEFSCLKLCVSEENTGAESTSQFQDSRHVHQASEKILCQLSPMTAPGLSSFEDRQE